MRSPSSLCVCESPLNQLLNAWTNICETRYVFHGTWAHLNVVFHKSHLSVWVPVVYPLSMLGNGSVKTLPQQRRHTQQ
jgi:hypothetical protein